MPCLASFSACLITHVIARSYYYLSMNHVSYVFTFASCYLARTLSIMVTYTCAFFSHVLQLFILVSNCNAFRSTFIHLLYLLGPLV